MKLSVSAFRGAQTSARKKLFCNTQVIPYCSGGTPFKSTTAGPTTTSRDASPSTASIPAVLIVDDEMMVDSTGLRAKSASDRSIGADTSTAQLTAHVTPSDSSASAAKCFQCDVQRPHDKSQRTRSNQRWMKLRTTVQLSGAISSTIQKSKPQIKREDSFLKRFSTRQMPEMQETLDTGDDGDGSSSQGESETLRELRRRKRRHRKRQPSTVVNPDENFYFYWLFSVTVSVLYNLWTLIVRQSFPEFQRLAESFWVTCDNLTDLIFLLDIVVQFRTGYLEQGLVVYDSKKLALHYVKSRSFVFDLIALLPLQLLQRSFGTCPILRFPRFLKIYRVYNYYYMVESRTVYPNFWRVANLIHILLILAHWFGCFYYLLSEAEKFKGDWVFPNNSVGYDTLTRKYLGSLYWSTLTLTTIGDLPTPETDADRGNNTNGTTSTKRRRYKKSRILQFRSDTGFVFTIVSYLIGVFIFATIVGQVGNVITNRNANRLEFERLLDGAKTYMRHHKVPNGMKRRVLRWYDYSWSRGRIQGGGDINTALGLLPDKLKTELALHVNLSVLKKVTIFQECQPEFLHDLVLKMKAFIFTPGDLICRKGEVAREMFIIADGILEVISDTGHVLTTMMAGDFFGEIGILNLDGLNKRTADVRSVGYSELFSLSREDVLAAMKDYPEAQEILQSLGRKRLMEARSISKAIVEQKNRAKLNAAAANNTAHFSDHRTKNKIVGRIYSDVKGLKSVLRRSRHSTKSDDSLELEPLTSICGQTESHFSASGKGTLCRMQKVTSDEHWPDENSSIQDSRERRISAGFPLLSKLKTLTDKHQQQQQQQRCYPTTSLQQQAVIQPSDVTLEPEPLGAGLPLLQRLLLLKQKENAEKRSAGITLSSDPAMSDVTAISGTSVTLPTPDMSSTVTNTLKKLKNGKKEVAFAEEVLVERSTPNVDEKRRGSDKDCVSGSRKRELARPLGCLEGGPCGVKKLPSQFSSTPWSLLRKANVNQNRDDGNIQKELVESSEEHDASASCSRLNPHRTLSRLYGNISAAEHTSGSAVFVDDRDKPSDSTRGATVDEAISNDDENDKDDKRGGGGGGRQMVKNVTRRRSKRVSPSAGEKWSHRHCRCRSVDDLFLAECWRRPATWPCRSPDLASAVRSCSLDSCITRRDNRARFVLEAGCALLHTRLRDALPDSCETLERRELKNILKRISFGSRRIRHLLSRASAKDVDGKPGSHCVDSRFELLRRLMRAPTIEGFVARRSTLEKSVACDTPLGSPPPNSVTSTTLHFSDYGDDDDDDDSCSGGSSDDDLSDGHRLCSSSNRRRPADEVRIRDIEYQVREKDQLIRTLRWKIAELRKHHERCFQEQLSDDDVDSDTMEHPFLRNDSVDTVLLSPPPRSCWSYSPRECGDTERKKRIGQQNRRSWEDRSEEERLELRELPSSIKPRPLWRCAARPDSSIRLSRRNEVRIDMGEDEWSASDTDEPLSQSDDELLLGRHDRNWEVRMLARELDRREHRASVSGRLASKGTGSEATTVLESRLRSMHSLEERCGPAEVLPPSQRSASSDDIYKPSSNMRATLPAPASADGCPSSPPPTSPLQFHTTSS